MKVNEIALDYFFNTTGTHVLLLPTSKNAESRILPLVGSVLTLMERKWEQKEGSEFIFHYENGRPIGSIEHSWRTACRRAGMCDKLFHDLPEVSL